MKSYQWQSDAHIFYTQVVDGHVILSVKSRISDTPAHKFLLTQSDSEGLRDILNDAEFDIRTGEGSEKVMEEVPHV